MAFADDSQANEVSYSRAVGDYLGIKIEEVPPSRVPLFWFAERAQAYRDFPGFPNWTMADGLLRQASSRGSRAIMNGGGGDEWLAGSRTYFAEELAGQRWRDFFDCLKTNVAAFGIKQTLRWLVRHGFFPLLPGPFQVVLRRLIRGMRRSGSGDVYWLSPKMKETVRRRRRRMSDPHYDRVRCAGQHDLLATLREAFSAIIWEEVERAYAGHELEPRRPLHTPAFVQYAVSTPERLRLRGDQGKYIHVQAMKRIMPEVVLERRGKAEFSVMFREHLDRMKETMVETLPRERPWWVIPGGVARLFRAYHDSLDPGWPEWILWSLYGCHLFFSQGLRRMGGVAATDPMAAVAVH